jgi:hypothetical protein
MAQDLTVNIKTTSDVPEAMNKAKTAVTGFDKQLQDIRNKFGTSFKDIFLSALGPMALVASATAFIGKLIADNQKKQEDANRAAIQGTNELMSAQDRYYANKLNNEKKDRETVEQAAAARAKITKDFLENDPRGKQMYDEAYREKFFGHPFQKTKAGLIQDDPEIQSRVQAIIAEDARKNPQAGINPEQKSEAKAGTFKGPEGFGTVVGVGANPVMEAMTRNNEILEEIKLILQEQSIQNRTGEGVPPPFTDRAVPLTAMKEGIA